MKKPTIISVVSAKGGVGKTSLSMTLACISEGVFDLRTLLVDTDDQVVSGSAEWLEQADSSSPFLPEHADAHEEEVLAEVQYLDQYDVIILDTPPRLTTTLLTRVLELSDFVVAATTPRSADVTPAVMVMRHVQQAGGLPKTLLGFGLVDTLRQGVRSAGSFRSVFDDNGWGSIRAELRKYASVETAIARGTLPGQYVGPSSDRANADAVAFTVEVLQAAGVAVPIDRIDEYWRAQGVEPTEAPYSPTIAGQVKSW